MPRREMISVCVDSSIFLAEVFDNQTHLTRMGAIDRYQKIFQFKKCMSETVKNEVSSRMHKVEGMIELTSKTFAMEFRSSKGEEPMINLSDLTLIRSLFSNFKRKFRTKASELEIIKSMEWVLVQYLVEKHYEKKELNTNDFVLNSMVEFNKKLSWLKHRYDSKLEGYEIFSIKVNFETLEKLRSEKVLEKIKSPDIQILCEVEAYKRDTRQICLLATVDDGDFLSNSETIESLIGVKCVDPIYIPSEFNAVLG